MTSDYDRREVAARLREHSGAKLFTGDDVERLIWAEPSGFRPKDADTNYNLLADLIDRPTCHLELTDVETHGNAKVRIYECSECGRTCEEIYGKYERCPHCGAEVVEDGD